MKPRPVATEASIAKVLDRLAGWGVKVRVPAHPTLEDVWRGTDTVLRNLPDTSVLTLDALVGHSRLRRYTKKMPPPPSVAEGGGGCSVGAASAFGSCGSIHRQKAAGDRGGSCSTSQQHRATWPTPNRQGCKASQQPPRGGGEGEDGGGGGVEDEAAAAAGEGGSKTVEDELGQCDEELQQVELALASTLQRIATTVEEFRYDEDSPEEARRIAFREKTLRAYEPLEERERQAKAEVAARMSKQNQVELKRKKEEDIAVCYVCNSGDHVENKEDIVFCERCCVAVHMSCYNAEEIHKTDNWYCDFCSYVVSKAQRHLEAVIAAAESASSVMPARGASGEMTTTAPPPPHAGAACPHPPADSRRTGGGKKQPAAKKQKKSSKHLLPAPAPPVGPHGKTGAAVVVGQSTPPALPPPSRGDHRVGDGAEGDEDTARGGENRPTAAAAAGAGAGAWKGSPGVDAAARKEGWASPGAVAGWQSASARAGAEATGTPPTASAAGAGAGAGAPRAPEEIVAAAEAWCGVEASRLKRDAQQAKKRSWDDFENGGNGSIGTAEAAAAVAAAAVDRGAAEGARSSTARGSGGETCSSNGNLGGGLKAPPPPLPPPPPPPPPPNGWQRSAEMPSPTPRSCAASASDLSARSPATCSPPGEQRIASAAAADGGVVPTTTTGDTGGGDTPEVAAARVALEEAEECVGVDLPSLDKGPPDAEADCILCHIPRGALLRAERGTKGLGWCHCLCAFSKGLLIEDRVVKTRGRIKGDGSTCGFCKRTGGGIIECSEKDCRVTFHPLCGKPWGGSAVRGPHLHPDRWTAWCPKHSGGAAARAAAARGLAAKGPFMGGGSSSDGKAMVMPVKEVYKISKAVQQKTKAAAAAAAATAAAAAAAAAA
ncbi:unnamed protein product, partial [Ectocarpus sp. 8 AP-2014]